MFLLLYRLNDGTLATEWHKTRYLADGAIRDIKEAGFKVQLVQVML
jgi:hypothetical protein